jgi:hypothetical protein
MARAKQVSAIRVTATRITSPSGLKSPTIIIRATMKPNKEMVPLKNPKMAILPSGGDILAAANDVARQDNNASILTMDNTKISMTKF